MVKKSSKSFSNPHPRLLRLNTILTLFTAIAIVVTLLVVQQATHYQQDAAMKMSLSPMPTHMPRNGKIVTVFMVHKGMTMNGGGGMNGVTEQSDSDVDTMMIAAISPAQTGNNKGNMNMGVNNNMSTMHDMFFSPKTITISVGTTVKWVNKDPGMKHDTSSIRRHGAESWDSGSLKSGDQFEHTFTHAGVYPYDCDIHPWMRGVIKVVSVDSISPTPSMPMTSNSPMPSRMPRPSRMPMSPTIMPSMGM